MRPPSSSRCYSRLRELILASAKIAVDETVAPVLDPGRGRTKQGYFWAIARDDRPWGGTDPPAIAFSYAPGRGAVHGLKLLEGYRGIVQCDGYAAYKKIAATAAARPSCSPSVGPICGAGSSTLPRAAMRRSPSEALERIAALYAIEKTIRGKSAEERRAVRQDKSKPLVVIAQSLARAATRARLRQGADRRGDPLRLEPLGRAHPFP